MGVVKLWPLAADRKVAEVQLPGTLQTPSGLAILDIQGTLNMKHDAAGTPSIDQECTIGRLSFPLYDEAADPKDTAWHKRAYLFVGDNQRLTGEMKKLPNPMAVVRKCVKPRSPDSTSIGTAAEDTDLEVAEVIYYKISFTSRPEPVGVAQEGEDAEMGEA